MSPFELNFHKVDPGNSQAIFLEALDAVVRGLTHRELNHEGPHFSYSGVPMELRPLQEPHPPIWYPTSNSASAAAVGKAGYNFVTLGAMDSAKACIDAFAGNFSGPFGPALEFPGGAAIGISRHVVVADTDEDAIRIARPAYRTWHGSLTKLFRDHGVAGPTFARGTLARISHDGRAHACIRCVKTVPGQALAGFPAGRTTSAPCPAPRCHPGLVPGSRPAPDHSPGPAPDADLSRTPFRDPETTDPGVGAAALDPGTSPG